MGSLERNSVSGVCPSKASRRFVAFLTESGDTVFSLNVSAGGHELLNLIEK